MRPRNSLYKSFPRPLALIFGAGATRGGLVDKVDIPPPVDNDFFDIAAQLKGHGTPRIAGHVLRSVWELYGRTSGISLERYYRDIETRTAIGRFAKTSNKPKDWRRRQDELEELIRRVYIHTTCNIQRSPGRPIRSEVHRNILSRLKPNDTVITFNYDLLIEESIDPSPLWNPVDGYGLSVQGKTHNWCKHWLTDRSYSQPSSKIKVLKLHGSLNWRLYKNNRIISLKHYPYFVRTRNGKPLPEEISVLPPGWNKRIDQKPYREFWRSARLALETCKTLIILGYSLPETDLLAQALFAEVVRTRKVRGHWLKELYLADPNQAVKERFVELFIPSLAPNSSIFKYRDIQEFSAALSSGPRGTPNGVA